MLNFLRWYNQNKNKVLKIIAFVVFFIMILQVLNYLVKNKNNNENKYNKQDSIKTDFTDLSLTIDKSVLTNEKLSSNQVSLIEIINSFYNFCNEGNIEKAYNLLTDECKAELYPSIKDFDINYYKVIFNGNKKNITLENWIGNIYKAEILNDLLATGIYNEGDIKQEYVTLVNIGNNEYKLNINNYLGKTNINKTKNYDDIEITVQSKDSYIDYEIYTFSVKNNTNYDILLDDLQDLESMYIQDENNIKYSAYTHENFLPELLIKDKENRTFKIKYYNKYVSSKKIKRIVFSRVIKAYSKLTNIYGPGTYDELKIEL